MKHFQDLSYCICSSQVWLVLRKKSGKIQRELKNITKKQPSNIYRSIIIANHLLIWLFSQALLWLSFCRKCCGWRELICEPIQACHLQGPGSHHRSCCCATSLSMKFIHNHLLLDQPSCCSCYPQSFSTKAQQTTSLPIYLFTNLTSSSQCWLQCRPHPLTSCHPTCALVELAKWMQEHV